MRLTDDPRLSDRRVTEYFLLEKARKEQKQSSPSAAPAVMPVITISREYGAGGRTVAGMVARELGPPWQVWDRELIDAVATSAQLRQDMVEALDERVQTWMQRMAANLLSVRTTDPGFYRQHLAQVLLALAQQGFKIIVGRGANFLLPDALNVRLCASLEFRIRAIMKLEGIDRDAAVRRIHRVDHERADFAREVFGRDASQPQWYDLFIQTDAIGFEGACGAIVGAARAVFRDHLGAPCAHSR